MTIIKVENLGKKYILTHQQREPYTALRDVMANGFRKMVNRGVVQPWKRLFAGSTIQQLPSSTKEAFWALKDVSFEIARGDRVGIIGRNGAGKSTLLKVLSRITEPTEGRVRIRGRVASLLEVGTGFHPELTGRENIFLNGAVLGMTKAEIKRKFDEIVAFAEVEKFLDTPVKHYSSGMYVRLAFAVAAHLEPEILVVDEVLAVGDAQFQKKCLGKMEDVSTKEGRTVIFVSHNMAALQALCTKALQLENGRLVGEGAVNEQMGKYLESLKVDCGLSPAGPRKMGPNLIINKFQLTPNPVESGNDQEFFIEISSDKSDRIDSLVILIYSSLGARVSILDLRHAGFPLYINEKPLSIRGTIKNVPFVEGEYSLGLYVESSQVRENFLELAKMTVTNGSNAEFIPYHASVRGIVQLKYEINGNIVE